MHYGERLKALRSTMGLSQQELAHKLNINRSTYARYELGQTQPDFETLQKIADFFNVTVDYLLGRSDHPNEPEWGKALHKLTETDVAKRMDELREDLQNDKENLSFSGEPLSEEAIESLLEALEYARRQITRINNINKKYIPKKYG